MSPQSYMVYNQSTAHLFINLKKKKKFHPLLSLEGILKGSKHTVPSNINQIPPSPILLPHTHKKASLTMCTPKIIPI